MDRRLCPLHGGADGRPRAQVASIILLVLAPWGVWLALGLAGLASANGEAVEIFRGRQGLYEVIVRVLPPRPVVGIVHFSVTPLDAATQSPVTDAEITIVASDSTGQPRYQARALNTPLSPQRYESNITFGSSGAWTIRFDVSSPGLGAVTVGAPMEVHAAPVGPTGAGAVVFLGVFAVLVAGGTYVWYSSSRRRRRAAGA